MSYTVLARKWRPQNFRQLIGQEHVQRAIVNAIEQNRLHHAYLFTGTRGVGKTTIARIFSKCLNCEVGITANPCGECAICQEIEQGHFVDLLEIDAASRTKVEDTREILDNVQYRPSRGRYKVYLIDEVHMLSNSSFNALLKTLEEPPPHVIFLLATTDPQKLPITVLSRCLQFHLKRMAPEQIVEHLAHILTQESIKYDDDSLKLIAKAADGSMRDSLSLLDQAIAFGAGKLCYQEVAEMLGAVDQQFVSEFLLALAQNDAKTVLEITERMAEFAPDYQAVLAEIISSLHQLAVAQLVGIEALDDTRLHPLLDTLTPEDVQLFYQLAIHARKDLPLAPDAREGFEMALLRIIAFRPISNAGGSYSNSHEPGVKKLEQTSRLNQPDALLKSGSEQKKNLQVTKNKANDESQVNQPSAQSSVLKVPTNCSEQSRPADRSIAEYDHSTVKTNHQESELTKNRPSVQNNQVEFFNNDKALDRQQGGADRQDGAKKPMGSGTDSTGDESRSKPNPMLAKDREGSATQKQPLESPRDLNAERSLDDEFQKSSDSINAEIQSFEALMPAVDKKAEDFDDQQTSRKMIEVKDLADLRDPSIWHDFIQQLNLTGTVFQVLNNSCVKEVSRKQWNIALLPTVEHFCTESVVEKIRQALASRLKQKVTLVIESGVEGMLTPRMLDEQRQQQRLEKVFEAFRQNPKVDKLLTVFSGQLKKEDIKLDKRNIH